MPTPEEVFANPENLRKIAQIEIDVIVLLASNPPSPMRFSEHILTCYWLDEPDQGSVEMKCEHCRKVGMLGPKSVKLKNDHPNRFHVMCIVCALAVIKVRASLGESVETHHPDDWPWFG